LHQVWYEPINIQINVHICASHEGARKKSFIMKRIAFAFFLLAAGMTTFSSCTKEETITVDTALPQGTITASKSGNFVEQNMTGSKGKATLGSDTKGVQFLTFDAAFSTVFATGTVSVYLSTTKDFVADPANGNPNLKLVGPVFKAGENFFKLDPKADAKFTHVILWCGTASVPFGYAELK
jgi:Electron transfer DM13